MPAHTGKFGGTDPLRYCPESRTGPDRLKLHGIADQNNLCASLFYGIQHTCHLQRRDHACLVDDEDVTAHQLIAPVIPGMLPRGKRSRSDGGTLLQPLGSLAGKCRAQDAMMSAFPGKARSCKQCRLARTGKTDDSSDTAVPRYMLNGFNLLKIQPERLQWIVPFDETHCRCASSVRNPETLPPRQDIG